MFKKLLAIVTAASIAVGTCAFSAFAEDTPAAATSGKCGEEVIWSFDESTGVLTIAGTGDMYTSYTPVDKWEYYPYRNEIKEVVVEKGVTSIAQCAFGPLDSRGVESTRYPNLAKITLSETIKSIEDYAFYKTGLECIELPEGLETIGVSAFSGTSLSGDLVLPKTLNSIGQSAFSDTGITSVNLNEGMSLGGHAFMNCGSLKEVTVPKNLFYKGTGAFNAVRQNAAFSNCKALEKVVILGGGIVYIDLASEYPQNGLAQDMFMGCTSLKEVVIKSDNISYVDPTRVDGTYVCGTFDVTNNPTFYIYKDSITEKTLKDAGYLTNENFVYIADKSALEEALKEAENVNTSLYTDEMVNALKKAIEAGKAVIADEAASQADVDNAVKAIKEALTIPTSGNCGEKATWSFDESTGVLTISGTGDMYTSYTPVDKWGYYPYRNEIKEVVVEKGVTSIAQCAFGPFDPYGVESTRYPNLAKITLSETIKSIGDYAFHKTGLEHIEFSEGLETIGVCAFSGSSLSGDLTLPKTLNSIGQDAFLKTNITSVNLHEGMLLGGCAFAECNNLKEVTIPENLIYGAHNEGNMTRSNKAFVDCKGLEKVTILGGGTVRINLGTDMENGLARELFRGCTSLKDIIIKADDISYVEAYDKSSGGNIFGTFDITNNPTFYIYKDSITEKTLKDAGYLTNENFVYIADKSALEEALKEAENVNTSLYTDEMVNAFNKAIEAGKAVIADEAASQADVDNAVKAIKEALTIPTSGNCGEKATWSFDESTGVLTISGTGDMYENTPVDQWEYYPLRDNVKEVVVEEGITSITYCAFGQREFTQPSAYPNLSKLSLPSSVKSIEKYAFEKSGLTSVEFSEGLETIDAEAFNSTKLSGDLVLPRTLNTIGQSAFSNTNITLVNLNEGMTLGGKAFSNCNNLKEVIIPKDIFYLMTGTSNAGRSNAAFSGCEGLKKVTIYGGGIVAIAFSSIENGLSREMFFNCPSLEEVIIRADDIEYVEEATLNASGVQVAGTFDIKSGITFYIYKDSTTEKTLIDAGYLTDENFVYIANTSALEEAVKSAEDMDTSLYTSESVDTLNKAIEAGKALIADEDAKQEDVDNAVKAIEDAIAGLELMPKGSISGTVKAPNANNITVEVSANGGVVYTTGVANGEFTIPELESGEYEITFTAVNCAPRSYNITVKDGNVELSAEIHLYGDINGDGKITTTDVGLSNAHAKGIKALEGYDTEVADISKDGKVTTTDVGAINSHAQGVRALW